MGKLSPPVAAGIVLALLSQPALCAKEEPLDKIFLYSEYAFILIVVLIFASVFFYRSKDRRRAPLRSLFAADHAIHSVGPDTPVIDCVRSMAEKKIGALIVVAGDKLIGIFTERDALNKVLAAGLDPLTTRISEVMTKDPYCATPTMTVSDAMETVTKKRFRHLPVMEDGKVLAVVSSGDLTHWLVKDEVEEVQELVQLATRS